MQMIHRAYQVFKAEGAEGVIRSARSKLAQAIAPGRGSQPTSLGSVDAELEEIAIHVKEILSARQELSPDAEMRKQINDRAPWFQRIELPDHGITTTDEPTWAVFDGAPDNSLRGRLTGEEAAILRPLPKWMFIRRRLPDITGKSVLEVGSNCGFFSFEFAEMGAKQVTGIETIQEYVERSLFLRNMLGLKNVQFVLRDFCVDGEVAQHDIVFSSEVINHFIFPFFGIYRILKSARNFAIIDISVSPSTDATCRFHFSMHTRYHSFGFSDSLLTSFFVRCGVNEGCIVRYPYANRCLYILDVSEGTIRASLDSADDPLWSGKFDFNPTWQLA